MRKSTAAILCSTMTAACGLLTPYKPPEPGAPSATLIAQNASDGQVTLWPFSNPADCTGHLDVDSMFNMKPGSQSQIAIAVGKDFSIGAMQDAGYAQAAKTCNVDVTFRPEANRRYVVTYSSDNRGCSMDVQTEVTEKGTARLAPEPSLRQRKRTGTMATHCE